MVDFTTLKMARKPVKIQKKNQQVVVDVTTLKMARKPAKIQKKNQQDALGKVNREKEISRSEKEGLKITDNSFL